MTSILGHLCPFCPAWSSASPASSPNQVCAEANSAHSDGLVWGNSARLSATLKVTWNLQYWAYTPRRRQLHLQGGRGGSGALNPGSFAPQGTFSHV